MSKLWMFDPGHGNRYYTKGKRSVKIPPGVYEGENNRLVCQHLRERLEQDNIHCVDIVSLLGPYQESSSLQARADLANLLYTRYDARYLSIHANAHGDGTRWTPVNGHKVFHWPGSREGKRMADFFSQSLYEWNHTIDRGVEARRYDILGMTHMPAVLIERGFMTNGSEAARLASEEFTEDTVCALYHVIRALDQED
jgi:N-acetylmuramoyl-L-alanine amidase